MTTPDPLGEGAAGAQPPPPNSAFILVVEDSPFQSKFYQQMLQRSGYAVRVVESGEQAMEAIQEKRPDLVLLDINLPGVSGLSICTALRDNASTHDVPIIVLTSKSDVGNLVTGMRSGADDFVGKQEDTGMLLARIARLLDRTRMYRRVSDAERLDLLRSATTIASNGIRTPLRLAYRSLEVMEGYRLADDKQNKARLYLRQYLDRIGRLLQNIEDVSRLASKSFVARDRVLDLRKALEEAEEMARNAPPIDLELPEDPKKG